MTQFLAYAETMFDGNASLETILTTSDDSKVGCIVEVYLKILEKIEQKNKVFSICSESKLIGVTSQFENFMKNEMPKNFHPVEKLVFDQADKRQ